MRLKNKMEIKKSLSMNTQKTVDIDDQYDNPLSQQNYRLKR